MSSNKNKSLVGGLLTPLSSLYEPFGSPTRWVRFCDSRTRCVRCSILICYLRLGNLFGRLRRRLRHWLADFFLWMHRLATRKHVYRGLETLLPSGFSFQCSQSEADREFVLLREYIPLGLCIRHGSYSRHEVCRWLKIGLRISSIPSAIGFSFFDLILESARVFERIRRQVQVVIRDQAHTSRLPRGRILPSLSKRAMCPTFRFDHMLIGRRGRYLCRYVVSSTG